MHELKNFLMVMCYVRLWCWPLTFWSWTFTAVRMFCIYTLYYKWVC